MAEKVKGLYLSKNMEKYAAAYYQKEFMDALADELNLTFYGPGFPRFNEEKQIDQILQEGSHEFDCIILGHSWFRELADQPVAILDLGLESIDLPIVAMLNKEYNFVEQKLRYLKSVNCVLLFSHHHHASVFGDRIGATGHFIPFGFPRELVYEARQDKPVDLFFSGLLKNAVGDRSRLAVMRTVFNCLGDLPITKRTPYTDLEIFWNSIPRKTKRLEHICYRLSRLVFPKYAYRHLSRREYFSQLARTKLVLGSVSPGNLIGPRFFESMASGAVVLCEESAIYDDVLPSDILVTYQPNMSDFEEKFFGILFDKTRRSKLAEKGRTIALNRHSWSSRAREVAKKIEKAVL